VWWSNSCSSATVIVAEGYTYYHCESYWFSRSYYSGEVVYTVVDTPPGH